MKSHRASEREKLKKRMAETIKSELESLSPSMKSIFIEDIITAFESRLKVLSGAQANIEFFVSEEVICSNAEI